MSGFGPIPTAALGTGIHPSKSNPEGSPRMILSGPPYSASQMIPLTHPPRLNLRGWASWVCVLALVFGIPGCSPGEKDVLTREQMWEWIGRHVQVGMPLDAASTVMGKAGFECTALSKTTAKIIDIHKTPTVGTFDLLKCEREDGEPPIKRHWEISLVHEGGKVKAIGVRHRDVYPTHQGASETSAP